MGNYSIKNISLGIGIGLIISSMININAGSRELTAEEIKKEAVKHDLIVFTREEILNNKSQENAPAAEPTPTATPEPTAAPTPSAAPAANAADTAPSPSPAQKQAIDASSEKITVEIISGMSSERIAELLKDKGVIKDTKAFLKRLVELDKEDKLMIGNFQIPKDSGYDEIIKILTR